MVEAEFRKLKVTPEHIDWMKEVWEIQRNKLICIKDMKNMVWLVLRFSYILSKSTLSSIIKKSSRWAIIY